MTGNNRTKSAAAVALVACAIGFAYMRYRSATPDSAEGPPPPPPGASGIKPPNAPPMPSKEQREKMRSEMLTTLELSPDQIKTLKKISSKYDESQGPQALGQILKEMGPHMTKPQQQKAKSYFENLVKDQMTQSAGDLPADQRARLEQKIEQRANSHQNQGEKSKD